MTWESFPITLLTFLRQGLSLILLDYLARKPEGSSYLHSYHSAQGLQAHTAAPGFIAGDPYSGTHACVVSTLLNDPSPQPLQLHSVCQDTVSDLGMPSVQLQDVSCRDGFCIDVGGHCCSLWLHPLELCVCIKPVFILNPLLSKDSLVNLCWLPTITFCQSPVPFLISSCLSCGPGCEHRDRHNVFYVLVSLPRQPTACFTHSPR